MDSRANFHVFCLLFVWIVYILNVVDCSQPRTPSWLSYWNEKLSNAAPPLTMKQLASPMTSTDTQELVKYAQAGTLGANSKKLCEKAHLACPAISTEVSKGPTVCVSPYFYEYGTRRCHRAAAYEAYASKMFFMASEMKVSNRVVFPKLANDLHGRAFLPRSLADALPFGKDRLSESLIILNVPGNSNMAKNMADTLDFCASAPAKDEVRKCHTSIESMVDFMEENLGNKVHLFSPHDVTAQDHTVQIQNIIPINARGQKSATCHDLMFPYLVYGCHVMSSAQALSVEMEKEDGTKLHGLATCHMDTSNWDSAHPAFTALNTKPGAAAICHWVPENNFVWVSAA